MCVCVCMRVCICAKIIETDLVVEMTFAQRYLRFCLEKGEKGFQEKYGPFGNIEFRRLRTLSTLLQKQIDETS